MSKDPYIDFATLYDEWQALHPTPFSVALAPRIEDAVRTWGVPRAALADVACGTGTFALHWAKRHPKWTVFGTDRSEGMIQGARRAATASSRKPTSSPIARSVARARSAAPTFIVQDLAHFELDQPVGLVTCLFDSVNHVTHPSALGKIFGRVHDALLPGGLFVFDVIDDDGFEEAFSGYSITNGRDLYVGMEMDYHERGGVGYGRAVFSFFKRIDRAWHRLGFELEERRWRKRELRALLKGAGLSVVEVPRLDPSIYPEVYVPRLLYIARRPT